MKHRILSFVLVALLVITVKLGAYFLIESVLYTNAVTIASYDAKERIVSEVDAAYERAAAAVKRQIDSASFSENVNVDNTLQLTDAIYKFRDQFELSDTFVTDGSGVVVAEASDLATRGDYVFDTTLYGKTVSERKPAEDIAVLTESQIIHLVAGLPILNNDNQITGGLFATQVFDQAFLQQVADRSNVAAVAVYTNDSVSASSFPTPEHNLIADSYFAVVKSLSPEIFQVDTVKVSGAVYLVYNVPFTEFGYRNSEGGVLYFIEQDLSIFFVTGVVIGVLLILLCGIIFGLRFQTGQLQRTDGFVMVFIVVIIVSAMFLYLYIAVLLTPQHLQRQL